MRNKTYRPPGRFTFREKADIVDHVNATKPAGRASRVQWRKEPYNEWAYIGDGGRRDAYMLVRDRDVFARFNPGGRRVAIGDRLIDVLPHLPPPSALPEKPRGRSVRSPRFTEAERQAIRGSLEGAMRLGAVSHVLFEPAMSAEVASIYGRNERLLLTVRRVHTGYEALDGSGKVLRRGPSFGDVLPDIRK